MTTVSIVIPTRDKATRLRLTLAALAHQPRESFCEIIVVDDGSTDGTASVVNEARTWLPIQRLDGGAQGRAHARNLGAFAAEGETLLFVDDDVLTTEEFVIAHRAAQDRLSGLVHGRLRELIGAVGLTDLSLGGPGCPPLDATLILKDSLPIHGMRLRTNPLEQAVEKMWLGDIPRLAPWLGGAGANISVQRDMWRDVGGFDEGFGTRWGCEDLEFAFRLHKQSVPLIFEPAALGIHMTHAAKGRADEHAESLRRFREKHPGRLEVDCLHLLLSPTGSVNAYFGCVLSQIRSA